MAGETALAVETLAEDDCFSEEALAGVLASLVRARSVNPGIYEAEMAKLVAEWLGPTGAEVTFVESLPDRYSVGAVLAGSGRGPRLVLNGHMDTVPIDDPGLWETDPFELVPKEDGFLYGRGACDMKAGLTVQIAVAQYLAKHRDRLTGSLVLHFAVGEECAEPGTLSLLEGGFSGDYGIVTEPTELRVATAQRGLAFYTIRIKGRSIHASRAHLGINPNARLPAVLRVIEEYEDEIRRREHPLCPGGSCTPTVIRAGVKENAVPDSCDVTVDRRLIPGETVDGELEALRVRLERIRDRDPDFEFELSRFERAFEPAEIASDSVFARRVAEAAQEVTGRPTEIYGTPYSSDVRNLVNDAGVEAVTFGPGNVAECHCANERVAAAQLRQAALATARVAAELLL
jgi:succinyl-diaminopimelate desuccinylase